MNNVLEEPEVINWCQACDAKVESDSPIGYYCLECIELLKDEDDCPKEIGEING